MKPILTFAILFSALAGCNTPGRGFHGVTFVKLQSGESTFDVRIVGDIAEAIRTSPHALPRFETIAFRSATAVERHSGCRVAWVVGDPSVQKLGLSCDGAKPPQIPSGPRQMVCHADLAKSRLQPWDLTGILICR